MKTKLLTTLTDLPTGLKRDCCDDGLATNEQLPVGGDDSIAPCRAYWNSTGKIWQPGEIKKIN